METKNIYIYKQVDVSELKIGDFFAYEESNDISFSTYKGYFTRVNTKAKKLYYKSPNGDNYCLILNENYILFKIEIIHKVKKSKLEDTDSRKLIIS